MLLIQFDVFPVIGPRAVLSLVAKRQVPQLVALMEHLIAHGEIYQSGEEDACPDRQIVGVNPKRIPSVGNPAPQLKRQSASFHFHQ